MRVRSMCLFFGSLSLVSASVWAQQDQSAPDPVPADLIKELEAQDETDLGNSVDDLLQNTLPALPADETASDADTPVGQAVEGGARRLNVEGPGAGLSETDAASTDVTVIEQEPEPEQVKITYDQYSAATLRALDKITGRSTDIAVETNAPIVFGSLNIEMKTCYKTPPELPPESAVFLSIKSTQAVQVETMEDAVDANEVSTVSEENPVLFSGWMFSSSPGLSALEHPVYDVWVISCKTS